MRYNNTIFCLGDLFVDYFSDLLYSTDLIKFHLLALSIYSLLLIYWIFRHLIFGAGRALRTINRMNKAMELMHATETENFNILDRIYKCSTLSSLWKPFYLCYLCKKDVHASDFINKYSVKAMTGFTGAVIIPLIMIIGSILITYSGWIYYLNIYEFVSFISIISTLIIVILFLLLNSAINKKTIKFSTLAECMLPEAKFVDQNEISESINKLQSIISQSMSNKSSMRSGGKDIEIQVIESILEACLKRLDENMGCRFDRLNTAIENSTKAQNDLLDKLKSVNNTSDTNQ